MWLHHLKTPLTVWDLLFIRYIFLVLPIHILALFCVLILFSFHKAYIKYCLVSHRFEKRTIWHWLYFDCNIDVATTNFLAVRSQFPISIWKIRAHTSSMEKKIKTRILYFNIIWTYT